MAERRAALLAGAEGRVLEIGAGTGLNLPFDPAAAELVLTEPEAPMARRLERRVAARRPDAAVVIAGAEELPFDDASSDLVVSTLVLCTVPEPQPAGRPARAPAGPPRPPLAARRQRLSLQPRHARHAARQFLRAPRRRRGDLAPDAAPHPPARPRGRRENLTHPSSLTR